MNNFEINKCIGYKNSSNENFRFLLRFFGLSILLFQFQFLTAQKSGEENTDTAFVYVDQKAVIFSNDESFNKLVRNKEVTLSQSAYDKSHSIVQNSAGKKESENYNLSNELKLAQEKEQQITLEKVKEEIEKFETKNKSSLNKEFYPPQSSDKFSGSKTNTRDYISPKPGNKDIFKQICFTEPFLIKKALGFLHTKKFFYYNNRSFDDCFSHVFSVRPPPFYS